MNPCSISMCEDILIEILSRLPAKSLVRFMSVCRFWRTIISSPQFRLASNRPTRLLVHTNRECYAVVEDEEKRAELVFEADFPVRHIYYDKAGIVGSDNGLICIAICSYSPTRQHQSLIVWNPSIRKHVLFPDHLPDGKFMVYSIGFGATNTGLDYKLVRIVGYNGGGTEKKAFHIYSLKSGTWRRFDLDNESYLLGKLGFSRSPALLRGRLHWVVNESSFLNYISTLDLEDEVFENKAMMLPQRLSTASTDYLFEQHVITVIKESLAVIAFESERNFTSVWMMQEYGDVGSWVKWCSIDLTISNFNVMNYHVEVVGVLKNGNLLLRSLSQIGCPSKLVTWDPKTMKTNDFGGGVLSPSQVCSFTNCYKESLVLLSDYEDRAVPDHKF